MSSEASGAEGRHIEKHTPGPWHQLGQYITSEPRLSAKNIIARAEVGDVAMADHEDVARANARLIASAPDLQAALKEMLNATLEERLPTLEVRQRAWRVFLASKGIHGSL